jgi:hypothetical protein
MTTATKNALSVLRHIDDGSLGRPLTIVVLPTGGRGLDDPSYIDDGDTIVVSFQDEVSVWINVTAHGAGVDRIYAPRHDAIWHTEMDRLTAEWSAIRGWPVHSDVARRVMDAVDRQRHPPA